MAELVPAPFKDLVTRLYLEPDTQDTLFDLPRRSWYEPLADAPDMTVDFHGKRAGNPSGPASGPHTQMAQNLVLCYIAGARIIELKTVQILDRLEIPRPCIDMTNVGYNVEWSQELLVEESLREYVAGMMLVEMLRRAHPQMPQTLGAAPGDVIYDISLGYDLKGIQSAKVQDYLDGIRDASALVEKLRAEIPTRFKAARDVEFPKQVSNTLTLSTFHGCPTDEIENICEFLLAERGLDVIVKMNPPTIGKDQLEHLLHDVMGYETIRVPQHAYDSSQTFEEALEMVGRLRSFAAARGRSLGCKFSNTLEVENHRDFFPEENETMYLSGAPLHVITITLASKFREAIGPDVPFSFSAGIDAQNFATGVACGFIPVTACSDLLKTGGYGRLPNYMKNLAKEMEATDAATIDDYILKVSGKSGDVSHAASGNLHLAAKKAQQDPRYRYAANSKEAKRIDSHLVIFDCLTCDKCIPVCPNDANFTYPAPKVEFEVEDFIITREDIRPGARHQFAITKKHQIANYAEFCNECGNCDTFCPEYDGPYIEKPSFYRTSASYEEAKPRDGFVVTTTSIKGRIKTQEYELHLGEEILFRGGGAAARFTADNKLLSAELTNGVDEAVLEMKVYFTLLYLLRGVLDESRVNQINVAFV